MTQKTQIFAKLINYVINNICENLRFLRHLRSFKTYQSAVITPSEIIIGSFSLGSISTILYF